MSKKVSLDNPASINARIAELTSIRDEAQRKQKEIEEGLRGFIKKIEAKANEQVSKKQREVQERLIELNTTAVEANGSIKMLETHLQELEADNPDNTVLPRTALSPEKQISFDVE